jgi:hypothetical protein
MTTTGWRVGTRVVSQPISQRQHEVVRNPAEATAVDSKSVGPRLESWRAHSVLHG